MKISGQGGQEIFDNNSTHLLSFILLFLSGNHDVHRSSHHDDYHSQNDMRSIILFSKNIDLKCNNYESRSATRLLKLVWKKWNRSTTPHIDRSEISQPP